MSDFEINEGECYRHILTHAVVRVTKVRWLEGLTGLVYWEALNGHKIEGQTFGIQETQHFLEDFYLVRVPAAIASCERVLAGKVQLHRV